MKTICLLITLTLAALAQDALTNESVVKMIKAGLGEGVIVGMIQSQPGSYALTPDDLVNLKQQGVGDKILGAMIAKSTAGSGGSGSGGSAAGDLPKDADIGCYFKRGTEWEEMLPEVVNWKTGGVLKHVATAGVVKGDVNGHLEGVHSRNSLKSPVEVVIYAPEGTAITEYQLLHLHEQPDSREFRTVTGGVMHESGGATRDVIPFEGKRVQKGVYKVLLPASLGAGEYGFLPPGAGTSHSSASIGKIYTFRIVE